MIMEYVPGESLARLAARARRGDESIPREVAAALMSGALHGLHAAHEATNEARRASGSRASRRVAAEHHRGRGRCPTRARFRHRQSRGSTANDARRTGSRQARVHGARTVHGRGSRSTLGRVRRRGRAVGASCRSPPLRRQPGGVDRREALRRHRAAKHDRRERVARPRSDHVARARPPGPRIVIRRRARWPSTSRPRSRWLRLRASASGSPRSLASSSRNARHGLPGSSPRSG